MGPDKIDDILLYLVGQSDERLKALILAMAEIGNESGRFYFDSTEKVFTDEYGVPLLRTYETFLKLYD